MPQADQSPAHGMRISPTCLSCQASDYIMQRLQKTQVHKRSVHVSICNPRKTEPTSIFLRMPQGCADGGQRGRSDCKFLSMRESIVCSEMLQLEERGKREEGVWSEARSSKGQLILPEKLGQ